MLQVCFFLLIFSLSSFAQDLVRLTGKQITTSVMDYGDPSIPDFLANGSVRVLTTNGNILSWQTTDDFFQGHAPQSSPLAVKNNEGEDLWDPSIRTDPETGEETLYGSVCLGDQNWNRRVYAFRKQSGVWVREDKPLLFPIPQSPSWLNHSYGHEFYENEEGLYIFYERVTEERQGQPWKTEIFARKMKNNIKSVGPEISILKIPETPWSQAMRSFGGSLVEGPRPFRKDGQIYVSFSAGDYGSDNYGIHLMKSPSINSPFIPFLNQQKDLKDFGASFERGHPMTWGAGRASYFQFKNKWWVIFHGIESGVGRPGYRDLYLAPAKF